MPSNPNSGSLATSLKSYWCHMRRLGLLVLFCYLGICLLLTLLQRKLIYLPAQENVIAPALYALPVSRIESRSFPGEDEVGVKVWLVSAKVNLEKDVSSSERRAMIVFHGNGHHRGGRGYLFELFNSLDQDVFIFDYPGYGETSGSPSEAANVANAAHLWDKVTGEWGYQPKNISLFGESLGGGIATQLAAQLSERNEAPAALIVRSTFSSLVDAASYHYPWLPVRWLLVDRYPSTEVIKQVTCPILVIHGSTDQIVPYELGERLYEAAPPESQNGVAKSMLVINGGGHNNLSHRPNSPMGIGIAEFLERIED
ncbi:Alpha/beta hydrolase family protein [Polystyrenella longa]|uniref:Alpha/beta hydrolase family protein n=1 Tax=Polystyrenella longa TaxID=2528007 RepID=A0A518CUH9_9PLAN|nr:alpha/beta hydrolase [Polystyrenella longa]QDU82844.1 Alpha/beta hydrolase family protein [Polystyrenella longa]